MNLNEWCRSVGVSKSNYYYWKKRLQSEESSEADPVIVKVPDTLPKRNPVDEGLVIEIAGMKIHVTEGTSLTLLEKVLKVAAYA